MSPLIHLAQMGIPKEFQLPEDIKGYFKDGSSASFPANVPLYCLSVTTGTNGTYVDSSELKQPRLKYVNYLLSIPTNPRPPVAMGSSKTEIHID